ncbi:MAG: SDR family NAD(P)-dependent oxidoreductase [Actinobacteria bacterium]|nr:SDR family NAD(P)-dependent oxidoreductase [Actinomycetota bacterium]
MTKQQTILVAGATGSIGNSAAVALAKRGARVVLLGRRAEKLSSRADSIRDALTDAGDGHEVTDISTLVIDFSDMDSVRAAAEEALNRFPAIDGLVLSVGAFIQGGPNVLPSGHEVMFATNVMGPFLFTNLLLERMQQSDGLVLHVIAPFHEALDWDDLESLKNQRPMKAFNRTKECNRVIAGELARRYAGRISSVAFDPTFVLDKSDPELKDRWPHGFAGFVWRLMAIFRAKPAEVAGEPLAELMLTPRDRGSINGALFVLDKRSDKRDEAMNDEAEGERLWDRLELLTGPLQR